MNTRFLLPVSFAAALHGYLLFGIVPGVRLPVIAPTDDEPIVYEFTAIPPVEQDPEPELFEAGANQEAAKKGNPELLYPGLDEPPPMKALFEIPRDPLPRPQVKHVLHISRETFGDWDGDESGTKPPGAPLHFGQLDKTPRTKWRAAPTYPPTARAAGITGKVVVELVVNEDGRVAHARVVESDDPIFNEATLRAVMKWQFEPGMKNHRPVRFRMIAPVMFTLDA